MSDLKILAQVIQNMASGMRPPVNLLMAAAQTVRETEHRLEALEAIARAAAEKLDLNLEQIGLVEVSTEAGGGNPETSRRRQATRMFAEKILSGG
jgi:nucleotide-binding universal stress UspA family protein